MYRVSPYFLSKTVTEIPGQLVPPILFSIVAYWMVGLQPDAGKFFTFIAVVCKYTKYEIVLEVLQRAGYNGAIELPMDLPHKYL
jgi:hypothetical protein